MVTTPDMLLPLPTPSVTPGPQWAEMLNYIQGLIDQHDHTTGKGVKLNQAGLNFNGDVAMNGVRFLDVLAVLLRSVGALSESAGWLQSIFAYQGDFYFRNGADQPVQLTSGNALAVPGSGAITFKLVSTYPYNVVAGDAQKVLGIDTSAARSLLLPAASTSGGIFVSIKDITGQGLFNLITVTPDASDTIEGVNAPVALSGERAAWGLIADGVSGWYII